MFQESKISIALALTLVFGEPVAEIDRVVAVGDPFNNFLSTLFLTETVVHTLIDHSQFHTGPVVLDLAEQHTCNEDPRSPNPRPRPGIPR